MLNSLQIKNFRSLEDFKVSKLGRVNLIVGKNKSGKSSVLEALRIYAGNANQQLLENISASHNEKFRLNNEDIGQRNMSFPFEDLFIGRQYPIDENMEIVIGETLIDKKALFIRHVFFVDRTDHEPNFQGASINRPQIISKAEIKNSDTPFKQALWVHNQNNNNNELSFLIRFENNPFTNPRLSTINPYPQESFIPTQFISVDDLAKEWDQIIFTEHEAVIKSAMRIILPDFENLAFVGERIDRFAKVKLAHSTRPVPLKSLGDGMIRVLQIALKLVSAKGSFLLIDEFENGLHYSTQEKIWALLFEMSERLNIQIFATTHSWDCIEAFTKVAIENETTEGVLFRMGKSAKKSNQGQIIATVFDKERLHNLTQADIEIR